jgi:hypothetical protein
LWEWPGRADIQIFLFKSHIKLSGTKRSPGEGQFPSMVFFHREKWYRVHQASSTLALVSKQVLLGFFSVSSVFYLYFLDIFCSSSNFFKDWHIFPFLNQYNFLNLFSS